MVLSLSLIHICVDMPIIEEVNKVLFEDKPAKEAVNDLMLRDKKMEHGNLGWED